MLTMIEFHDIQKRIAVLLLLVAILVLVALLSTGGPAEAERETGRLQNTATFYRDVLPILQERCQVCHRASGIAPMRLETYEQTRPYAAAISAATRDKSMPPWFADPHIGHFSNDPSLSPGQIAALATWADAGAPAGDPRDAPATPHWAESWSIRQPDLVLRMPKRVAL